MVAKRRNRNETTEAAQAALKQEQEAIGEWVDIDRVRGWEKNPKRHPEAQIKAIIKSFKRFGWGAPLLARPNGELIAGHGRLEAAKQLGLKKVPVRWMDLDPTEAHLLALADNKLTEIGEWDDVLVREILEAAKLEGADIDGLGWNDEELSALLSGNDGGTEGLTDPDAVPEAKDVTTTKAGDLWILEKHRLLCGDSTKDEDVKRLMAGQKADMMLSDPPYGVSYVGKTKDALKVENDALDEKALTKLVCDAFNNAQAVSRAGAYWYATVPPGPLHIVFADDWKRRGILRQIMVWAKDSLVLGHSEYHYQHEPILFGWIPGDRHKNGDRTRTTLWQYERPKANREHPTMKPVLLWEQAVRDGSRSGEVVIDPFCGSGTTLIAAEKLDRRCFGMEISPQYCDVIVRRWQEFTGKQATLEGDGRTFAEIERERSGSA